MPTEKQRDKRTYSDRKAYSKDYRAKNKEKISAYNRANYLKTKEIRQERSAERRRQRKQFVTELKSKPCARCKGTFPPAAMDFHHLDPETKEMNIGARYANLSMESLQKEIDKCILVCANCHRIIHQELRDKEN